MSEILREVVRQDEHGVWRVGEPAVLLESIVIAWQQGHSPETIQQQYPSLSLADTYHCIAWYLQHQVEADHYLQLQDQQWQAQREAWNRRSGSLVQRLRAASLNTAADRS